MNRVADWAERLFIRRADLSLRIMNLRWPHTEKAVEGMARVLSEHGIRSARVLDLCCGNGRFSIHFAKRGFRATGVDYSEAYLEDARRRAEENGVSSLVDFVLGDVRNLKDILKEAGYDVVISAWTSIGYSTREDDLSLFRQARELSREDALLFVIETEHEGRASMRRAQSSCIELDGMMLLEGSTYDPITSEQRATWGFYRKDGKDLEYIDELEYRVHVYSPSELASLLREAGWRAEALYGDVSTLQPISPFTSMNLVATVA